jgi:hypothetical protein
VPGALAVLLAFAAAFASACNDRRPPVPVVSPPFDTLRVVSVDVVPLPPDSKPADFDLSPPGAVSVDTARGRLTARVERIGAGPESRSFRIVVRQDDGGAETVLKADAVNVSDLAWSPGGRTLAFCEGTLVFAAAADGTPDLLYAGPGGSYPGACTDLAWSEDGTQLRFIQLQHTRDAEIANPARVVLTLERLPPAAPQGRER